VTIVRTTAMTPTATTTETTPPINHSIHSCMAPTKQGSSSRYVVIAVALMNLPAGVVSASLRVPNGR